MKRRCIVGIIFLCSLVSWGQIPSVIDHRIIDSLEQVLPETSGKERVDVLNDLAMHLAPKYGDSCLNCSCEALALATDLAYKWGEGFAHFNMGNCYFFRLNLEAAMMDYLIAEQLLVDYGPSNQLGNLFIQLAFIQSHIVEWSRAEKYGQLARQCFIHTGNKKSEMFAYRLIGRCSRNKDSAMYWFSEALQYYTKVGDTLEMIKAMIDISDFYFHQKRDSTGLKYGRMALALAEKTGHDLLAASACHKIANFYENFDSSPGLHTDLSHASSFLEKAIGHLHNTKESYSLYLMAESFRELADMQRRAGNLENMKRLALRGIPYNEQFLSTYDTTLFPDISIRLWYYSEALGNFPMIAGLARDYYLWKGNSDSARYYDFTAMSYSHAYNRFNMINQLNKISERFNIQLRDQNILLLTQENELQQLRLHRFRLILISVGGLIILLFLIFLLYFQKRKAQAERRSLEIEQKLLRARMNPHFLFNTLTSIQNYILAEKPDRANIFLSRFANLVRSYLDSSIEDLIPLETMVSSIENYLELQKGRYSDKFDYLIKVDDRLDEFETLVPPMMAQPFIENAIEHGIKHLDMQGLLEVRFIKSDHSIVLEIEDNGVGRKRAGEIETGKNKDHRSLSTEITRERIINLNKKLKTNIALEIIDKMDGDNKAAGTLVRIVLPLISS